MLLKSKGITTRIATDTESIGANPPAIKSLSATVNNLVAVVSPVPVKVQPFSTTKFRLSGK